MDVGGFFSLNGPLDTVPMGYQMRATNLVEFDTLVRRRGGDPQSVLERNGIDGAALLDHDMFMDSLNFANVLEDCAFTFDDPLFGLTLASMQSPYVFGIVSSLCMSAPNVKTAIQCCVDYIPLVHSSAAEIYLSATDSTIELRWDNSPDFEYAVQGHYNGILLMANFLRMVCQNDFKPKYAGIICEVPKGGRGVIEKALGCPIKAKHDRNLIGFSKHAWEKPLPSANRTVFTLLDTYLRRLKSFGARSIVERVEDFARGSLGTGNCTLTRCAKRLGLSIRRLQQELAESGTSFFEIVTDQRMVVAKERLMDQSISLDEVAFILGYSDQTSFGRAFRKATGWTPGSFRRDMLSSV